MSVREIGHRQRNSRKCNKTRLSDTKMQDSCEHAQVNIFTQVMVFTVYYTGGQLLRTDDNCSDSNHKIEGRKM